MELYPQVITDADDIYIYFEVIRKLNPKRILDFGMLLKRMGAVSRQAMHCKIPQSTRLEGVDICPDIALPIYQMIYDQIYDYGKHGLPDKNYDLAVCLHIPDAIGGSVLAYLSSHASAILFDTGIEKFTRYFVAHHPCQSLEFDGKTYGLAYGKGADVYGY